MKKIKYWTYRVGSGFERVIELNKKMLILTRIFNEKWFVSCQDQENWSGISSKMEKII
jgi:hypothetical protein